MAVHYEGYHVYCLSDKVIHMVSINCTKATATL